MVGVTVLEIKDRAYVPTTCVILLAFPESPTLTVTPLFIFAAVRFDVVTLLIV